MSAHFDLSNALEQQARRIAQVLHDDTGQLLTAAYNALAEAECLVPPAARSKLHDVRRHLDHVEEHLRLVAYELRPRVLADLGLVPALQALGAQVAQRSGIAVVVRSDVQGRLPAPVETTLYRVVQEALTNVRKHSHAQHVDVSVGRSPRRVRCIVTDNGIGFDSASALAHSGRNGLGLTGIRERLGALSGTLRIRAERNRGTCLVAAIPLAR